MSETIENRKKEHVMICLNKEVSSTYNYWDDIILIHRALPEVDYEKINTRVRLCGKRLKFPLVISAMTGGYKDAEKINESLAKCAEKYQIAMGVGSQRPALMKDELRKTYEVIKDYDIPLKIANIGAPQIIRQKGKKAISDRDIGRIIDMIDADVIAIHLNYLQEVVQSEGDGNAYGCTRRIGKIAESYPVMVKETGAGISHEVARQILKYPIKAIDVGGLGGTSFAAVEAHRADMKKNGALKRLGEIFRDWGIPAPVSVMEVRSIHPTIDIVATGGIRNGLDVARALVLGATAAGMARRLLRPSVMSFDELSFEVECIERELKCAMFLTGCQDIKRLRQHIPLIVKRCAEWERRV